MYRCIAEWNDARLNRTTPRLSATPTTGRGPSFISLHKDGNHHD